MTMAKPISTLMNPIALPHGGMLPSGLLPGPMEGVTSGSFLSAMSRRGWVSCWWTPFLRVSTGVPRRSRLASWLAPYQATGFPVIVQIMGTDPGRLAETAVRFGQLGAAAIDLNCACPSPVVVSNGSGGACLRSPDWLTATLCTIRNACPALPLGIKIRAGFASPAEMPALAAAVRAGAPDWVTLHYRTVREQYREIFDGLERLRAFRELLPDCVLIGSGDLFTVEAVCRMQEVCAVDGVAPARGLLRNPALLLQLRQFCQGEPVTGLTAAERRQFLFDLTRPEFGASGSRSGFVLRIAAFLLGEGDPLLLALRQCRHLSEVRQFLSITSGN